MYTLMRPHMPDLYVPDWLPVERDETLPHYAARMAETIPDSGGPLVLGGHSFGGMLAQEVARLVKPRILFLISTARSHTCIATPAKLLQRLMHPVPLYLIDIARQAFRLVGPMLRITRGVTPEQARAIAGMMAESPLDVSHAGARWATTFCGCDNIDDIPTFSIHGDWDHMFPIQLVKPDYVVHHGTHIIPITHAREVAQFMLRKVDEVVGNAGQVALAKAS